jgi:hypothetical protein
MAKKKEEPQAAASGPTPEQIAQIDRLLRHEPELPDVNITDLLDEFAREAQQFVVLADARRPGEACAALLQLGQHIRIWRDTLTLFAVGRK